MLNQPNKLPEQKSSDKKIGLARAFQPMILQTKEELLVAMKSGQLKTSKYNLLNDQEKMFVELVCFGGYTAEQAMRVISPGCRNPAALANRMMTSTAVSETMEELTVAKTKKFSAEIASARDMALAKLQYIMTTTDDPNLAASCAKTILDKSEALLKQAEKKDDEPVGQVKFNIQVENVYTGGSSPKKDEPVIIEISPEEEKIVEALEAKPKSKPKQINPDTGLPFVLHYEGVDNYNEDDGGDNDGM